LISVVSERKILVVEDDDDIRGLLVELLGRPDTIALTADDGLSGIRAFFERRPDLVVLDLSLPGLDGWEVLARIREVSDVPVLVLTADGEQVNKVRGLERGADDYVTKPFDPDELIARIQALLRRVRRGGSELVGDGLIALDEGQWRASVRGRDLELTPTEFRLLATLLRNRGRVVSQDQLLEEVWGNAAVDPKSVRLYVSYLRRKLGNEGLADSIETVRGFGYRLSSQIPVQEP
jgi:DNA-binding response OmpR family regulator